MRDVSDAFKRNVSGSGKDVHLVFIGLGTPRLGSQLYDRIVGSGFPNIHLYIDQPRAAYKAVGAAYGIPKFDCGKCCTGTLIALWQGTTRCWCICNAGDVEQQGAEFVMTPSNECKFRHMEKEPGDHAKEVEFFQAAGLDVKPSGQQMK